MNIQVVIGQIGQGLSYSYKVPGELLEHAKPGVFVLVPFGKKNLPGVITHYSNTEPPDKIKEVLSVLDEIPQLSKKALDFYQWIAKYYISPPGKVFNAALPFFDRYLYKYRYHLNTNHPLLNELDDSETKQLLEYCGESSLQTKLPLEYKLYENVGLISRYPYLSLPKPGKSSGKKKVSETISLPKENHSDNFVQNVADRCILNKEQEEAWKEIKPALNRAKFERFLLFGVTGSGKTEIYLRAAAECISNGKNVLILVPEIGLTPQNISIFTEYFKNKVFVRHSRIKKSVSVTDWFKIYDSSAIVVIGTRSAIFAPLKNIGLIIVDEEHDTSFKQQETEPYYSAKDAAVKLAEIHKSVYIAGSATPSIESYYNAINGKFKLLKITQKVFGKSPIPPIIINPIDRASENGIFYMHPILKLALQENLDNGKQCIILLNRRGYARLMVCENCKQPVFCPNCSIPCTYSQKNQRLECHHCFQHIILPQKCPSCEFTRFNFMGLGTERIETDIKRLFPDNNVMRIDSDTIKSQKIWMDAIQKIKKNEVDFIIGTQMITKGHDFPNIGLVVVMFPDLGLNFPDFRASERVFQLLVQTSGRTDRRKNQSGKVIVLSYNPSHTVINHALKNDYEAFYENIIATRMALNFPPYCRLALMIYDDEEETGTYNAVINLEELLRTKFQSFTESILGPIESPLYKINNRFHWQWLIRQDAPGDLVRLCRNIKNTVSGLRLNGKFRIIIDTARS